jgi:hypothetical protein
VRWFGSGAGEAYRSLGLTSGLVGGVEKLVCVSESSSDLDVAELLR